MRRSRLIVSVTTAVAGLALLSACGQATETAAPLAVQPAANAAAAADSGVKLTAVELPTIGQVLTDKDGFTLYRFDKDTAKPPKSNCDGQCATTWPPVIAPATGEVEVQVVDPSVVGKVTRTDGTEQVTVGGWAVYKYSKDTQPGDAKGQAVGGTWFGVTPTGTKAGALAEAPSSDAPAAENTKISAGEIAGIGPILTDQNGRTLYLFQKDTKKPSKSNCEGACATTWPPVIAKGEVQLEGVDKKLVGTVKRADGSDQVTVGGWPVYTYSKDTAPGQANGQGVGGTWFTIESRGCKSGTNPA
jgi:predicted lipoprotein with Yx(FWY)xxD motif